MNGTDCDEGNGGGFNLSPLSPLIDIPAMLVNAVTSFLGMLIEQIMAPVRQLLASTLLATPEVTKQVDITRL